jgi:Domain of unknown function (DUF4062)
MRIFVSSTFEDLREHRAASIRILRQLGHEVLAMEDLVAASAAPLGKVLDMVDRCEAYVGVFAWRYGYVPGRDPSPVPQTPPPKVAGANYGTTSITHYEYLRALERKLPVMAFLLDEQCPWPPQLIDGFDTTRPQAPTNVGDIRALRLQLQQERVVSWFTTPADLEARVSAAVTMAGLTSQLDLQAATALDPNAGVPTSDSSGEDGIKKAIVNAAENQQHALKISLATTWWSTRLYMIAAFAEPLTQVRQILIVKPALAIAGRPASDEQFVGQLSTAAILAFIGPSVDALGKFQTGLRDRPVRLNDIDAEYQALLDGWHTAFADQPFQNANETFSKVDLTPELLRRWFGDVMLQKPVHITDLQRASVVDLLRLLDYPSDYVPVLTRRAPATEGDLASEQVDVVDKTALNARLARSYLVELMDRARIV